MEKTREVYASCIKLIPHKKFTFAKIWLLFAKFELRQKNLQTARKILVSKKLNSSNTGRPHIWYFVQPLFFFEGSTRHEIQPQHFWA
jgi:hypothetical protein